jgi:glucosamine--fructose-6-phosphate aminotransferase (isomerizing)
VGADVFLAGSEVAGVRALPALRAHPAIEPLLLIQSFYRFANALALARGRDPDRPPHLRKVTETV